MSMGPERCIGVAAPTCGQCPGFEPLPGKSPVDDKGSVMLRDIVGRCPMTGETVLAGSPPIMARTIMEQGV